MGLLICLGQEDWGGTDLLQKRNLCREDRGGDRLVTEKVSV